MDKAPLVYRWFRSAACRMARQVAAAVELEAAEEQAAAVPGQELEAEAAPEPALLRHGLAEWFRCRNRK